ncbi:SMP-30/gluconolactonase/LRE family protein [Aquabacterium sp. A7-Y]|uniref:SMP-30/gluconolactonase/LRE family protein n=1 Tax=Aquabacterium sp. A7-Y TaxID=1349605 RepID=UPI00223DBCB9|nr:SMP-30/gluconolactonase/LRE family protein [Aquabacterium sp. A7-Y]MCW7539553.1 SMP-30/gluconolactonase/LRE family protein [Aquabacterium sp. A7-Y]
MSGLYDVTVAVDQAALLGEAPMWHPLEQALYYCDIAGHKLHRFDPATRSLDSWAFETDVSCCAATASGRLVLAMRDGLWCFDPRTGQRERLAEAPYDPAQERFNDGKVDPAGRWWIGTIYEPRKPPLAALYRLDAERRLTRQGEGVTVSNGLAWSPDGRRMYWSDTTSHTIFALDFDVATGEASGRRVFKSFELKREGQPLDSYGGRPDGGAVDVEGNYWVAMFEGSRLLQLSPAGEVLREVTLPVRCPTMPAFGGADLKTLYLTTSREKRPADELAAQPLAGCVLQLRVEVPGLPAQLYLG